jgi:hypothetical protein
MFTQRVVDLAVDTFFFIREIAAIDISEMSVISPSSVLTAQLSARQQQAGTIHLTSRDAIGLP